MKQNGQMTTRRVSIKTDLPYYYPDRKLPQITDEELTALIQKQDLNTIIEAKIRHALAVGSIHAAKYRHKRDEVGSLSLFHLVKGVHIFFNNHFQVATESQIGTVADDLNKYLTKHIFYSVRYSLVEDRLIRVPNTMINLKINETNSYCNHEALDILSVLINRLSPRCDVAIDTTPDFDLRDTIEAVLETDEERRILELRIIGCSDREVGETISRSISFIATERNRILHAIKMELMK